MKKIILSIFLSGFFFAVFANSRNNQYPVIVKSVITDNGQLQLKNQYINADIYRDAIYVECIYNIQNNGAQTTANIAIPYFKLSYSDRYLFNIADLNKIDIWINRYKIPKNSIVLNNEFRQIVTGKNVKALEKYEQKNKPMISWQTNFSANESLQITVRYTLPLNRNIAQQSFRYYTISSAWNRRIDEGIVNFSLKNILPEQVVNTTSKARFNTADRSYIWINRNYKPSDKSAIKLDFELYKTQPTKKTDNTVYYLDNKKISSKKAGSLPKRAIAYYKTEKGEKPVINLYSREFIIDKFLKNVAERYPELKNDFKDKNQDIMVFINGNSYRGSRAYTQLEQLKLSDIKSIKTAKLENYLEINITLEKYQSFEI